jgi:hypothetical protein
MSPWRKDQLYTTPRGGETQCLGNCKCILVRSDGAKGFGPVDMGEYLSEEWVDDAKGKPLRRWRFAPKGERDVARKIQREPIENAVVMRRNGDVWRTEGTPSKVKIVSADVPKVEDSIVVHNHSHNGPFSPDDGAFLVKSMTRRLFAVTRDGARYIADRP